MYSKKIIKWYFTFMILSTSTAMVSQNETVHETYNLVQASVIEAINYNPFEPPDFVIRELDDPKVVKDFNFDNTNLHNIYFSIENNGSSLYVNPGQKGVSALSFVIKTEDAGAELHGLNFKIHGAKDNVIKRAYLFSGEEFLASALPEGGNLNFSDFSFDVDMMQTKILSVRIDLNSEVSSGTRLRLDINEAEDIKMLVGGQAYKVKSYYPLQGTYLSVVRGR